MREVDDMLDVGENNPGSEKRTLFDLLVDGVLACMRLSDVTRVLTGDIASLPLFDFRRAIGMSRSDCVFDAMIVESSRITRRTDLISDIVKITPSSDSICSFLSSQTYHSEHPISR